jgi:hypothetical protein
MSLLCLSSSLLGVHSEPSTCQIILCGQDQLFFCIKNLQNKTYQSTIGRRSNQIAIVVRSMLCLQCQAGAYIWRFCFACGAERSILDCCLHSWASAFRHPVSQSGTGAFRYRTRSPYSRTGLFLISEFLFIPVPDWLDAGQSDIPAFLKKLLLMVARS